MTDIKDLELRIKSAESTLEMLRGELEELRQQQQQEPESLLGRWATHPEHGRGIIFSREPNDDGYVRLAYRNDSCMGGAETCYARPEDLTLDPVTLTTEQDFENAPDGTIVEATTEPYDVHVKAGSCWWVAGDTEEANPTTMPACRVARWGNGQ